MNIDLALNGEDLVSSERLYLLRGDAATIEVGRSTRIGINPGADLVWRFFVSANAFVSKGKPVRA